MSRPSPVAALVATLVVLAGCGVLPMDDASTNATPETPTGTPGPGETPATTPTPNDTSPYPPGVSESGVENLSTLLAAHTSALNATGYVAVGTGNTTIQRSGFLVNVTRDVRIVVAAGSARYHEVRRTGAGPVNRLVRRFSNGSVELRRHEQDGDVDFRKREPQSTEKLANVGTLRSFLRGGTFEVAALHETDEGPGTVLLIANDTENESALREVLPESAGEIRSYNASALVDTDGRVRALNATIGFVVGGNDRTHEVSFRVERVGVENVSRPGWVDEFTDGGDGDDEDEARVGPRPRAAHWSRLVVSTSGWRA